VYLDARALLGKNLFAEAIEKIREAISLYDQEPEHYMSLGWALFRQGVKEGKSNKIAEGKKYLVDTYNKEYFLAEVTYYLAMVAKHEGKYDQAASFLRKCIAEDSNHTLAMSELRFVEKKLNEKPGKKK
jgi:tetratricopeptide (TPR) repeat protein